MSQIYSLTVQILKFLGEILRNESGRMKPDSSNVNILMLWKVTQNWTKELLINLFERAFTVDHKATEFLLKVLGLVSQIMTNCLEGNYINFGMCEYYNDHSYEHFLTQIVYSILSIPQVSVLSYQKSSEKIVKFLCEVTRKQLSLLLKTVGVEVLSQVFYSIIIPALRETVSQRQLIMQTLDRFCDVCFENVIVQKSIFTK